MDVLDEFFHLTTNKPLPDTPKAKELRPVIMKLEACIRATRLARDSFRKLAAREAAKANV